MVADASPPGRRPMWDPLPSVVLGFHGLVILARTTVDAWLKGLAGV